MTGVARRRGALAAALILAGSLGVAADAYAQIEPKAGDTVGSYVVRPGDTLKDITERFLGDWTLWQENWRLNPNIKDPNLLLPGQELQIILDRKLPPRTVQVTMVARDVQQKPNPNPWTGADIGDLLQEEDGLRTGERSSAEVVFDDDTTLTLSEESIIFLRRVGSTLRGQPQETVEVVDGQADLAARSRRGKRVDIELIMGETVARPKPGADGRAETRARQNETGDSALMVFSGDSAVEAGGETVQVPKGMGTTIAPGAAPSPPERLLPAPRPAEPPADSSWDYSNIRFSWSAVRGAEAYVLEICRDAKCSSLVERRADLTDTAWSAGGLPIGDLFWRVSAIAPSGLDGYASRATPLRINSNHQDLAPPTVAAVLIGSPSYSATGAARIGRDGAVKIEARDDASGVASIEYRWDGGDWRRWSSGDLSIPDVDGLHTLELRATDRLDKTSDVVSVSIERIDAQPAPPTVYADPSLDRRPPTRDVH